MKVKTYFSSIAFYFSPPTEKKRYVYMHPIGLWKNSPTGSGNISVQSWKIWKSHGRLDPT